MSGLTLNKVMEIIGVNPYVTITAREAAKLKPDWRKPMPVLVTVNGQPEQPWKINMMPKGDGSFYLYLHGSVRKVSHTKVGDEVDVWVRFDDSYKNGPQHPMPDWFTTALEKSPRARQNWDKLPPSRKKEILRNFAGLKSEAAKQRNLTKALYVLEGNPGRFMARDWTDGI